MTEEVLEALRNAGYSFRPIVCATCIRWKNDSLLPTTLETIGTCQEIEHLAQPSGMVCKTPTKGGGFCRRWIAK